MIRAAPMIRAFFRKLLLPTDGVGTTFPQLRDGRAAIAMYRVCRYDGRMPTWTVDKPERLTLDDEVIRARA
jgi:hypothetical protein